MNDLNIPFSGLKISNDGMYSLAYSDFVMPLVNAVKELKKENDELKKKLSKIDNLENEMTQLKALIKSEYFIKPSDK